MFILLQKKSSFSSIMLQNSNNNDIYWNTDRKMHLLFVSFGLAAFFLLLYYLSNVLIPFVIAFLLAYILNPIVNILQKKVKHRFIASFIVLLVLLIFCVGVGLIFVPMIIEQGINLGNLVQKYASNTALKQTILSYIPDSISEKLQYVWQEKDFMPIIETMQNLDILKIAQNIFDKILPGAIGVFFGISHLFSWLFAFFIVALCLIFMLLDFENMKKKLSEQIPKEHSESILNFFISFDQIMSKYFRAQTSIAAIIGVIFATSFSIMGLPMGLPFGLFVGCLNMIPYLQTASIPIAAFLGLIYSLETGIAFWQVVLILTAIYAGIQVLQDSIITPKIMGGALGLSPVLILLSLAIWGKLLGFLGLVLAIPFTCVAIAMYKSFRKRKETFSL